jgi:mandelate racemase
MAIPAGVTVAGVRARAVSVPLRYPLQTASGGLAEAPLVLIDLHTSEGVSGRSYLFAYTPLALAPLTRLVENLAEVIDGARLAPVELARTLTGRLRLLGPKGLPTMALAGLGMAAWDALGKVVGLPVCRLLGGEPTPVPAYGSLKAMRPPEAAIEAAELAESGFGAYKGGVGYAELGDDRAVIAALREATSPQTRIAVDYNQALAVPEATRRLTQLADEDLLWVEEPTSAEDIAGHARIRASAPMPVQLGENWWGTTEMAASLAGEASDLAMIDVMRIGGVTGWTHAAGLADAWHMPLSSHLFPEVSAHLLAVTPTAHWLEYLDLASPILADPPRPADGHLQAPDAPGFALEWNEGAITEYTARR